MQLPVNKVSSEELDSTPALTVGNRLGSKEEVKHGLGSCVWLMKAQGCVCLFEFQTYYFDFLHIPSAITELNFQVVQDIKRQWSKISLHLPTDFQSVD